MSLAEPLQQVDRTFVLHRGRKLSYFGGCDYFRLASHPQVLRAFHDGAKKFGINVAAGRGTTGNHVLYAELEQAIADFFHADAAVLVATGYATNLVALQAAGEKFSHVLIDERSHGSLRDAACFDGARMITSARKSDESRRRDSPRVFFHRDVESAKAVLKSLPAGSRPLLMTDGMFSHDGSAAPLRELLRALPAHSTMLVDDAHGAGVLGRKGGGTIEHEGVSRARVIQTISLSKAFGCYGGAILCSKRLRDEIIERSRLFNGNTPLPLPLTNAALAAVRLLEKNPHWRERMHAHAGRVKSALRERGRDIPDFPGPIIAIRPRDAADARRLRARLSRHGVFPSLIQYAGSPGYFRFMISSEHSSAQLRALVEALGDDRRRRQD